MTARTTRPSADDGRRRLIGAVVAGVALVLAGAFIARSLISGRTNPDAPGQTLYVCPSASCGKSFPLDRAAGGTDDSGNPVALKCPDCGSTGIEPARVCTACGKPIAKSLIKHSGSANAPPPKCPHCGAEMPPLSPS